MGKDAEVFVHNYDVPMLDGITVRRYVSNYLDYHFRELDAMLHCEIEVPMVKIEYKIAVMYVNLNAFEECGLIRKKSAEKLYNKLDDYKKMFEERKCEE